MEWFKCTLNGKMIRIRIFVYAKNEDEVKLIIKQETKILLGVEINIDGFTIEERQ